MELDKFILKITETTAKTILTKSNMPDCDYVVNPYSGCAFGCSYCYAYFTRRFTGHLDDKWGKYVDVKINAAELLQKEIQKLNKKIDGKHHDDWVRGKYPLVLFSSVTDPYQGIEAKYEITRKCLEEFIEAGFNGSIEILTKSDFVIRDIDLLKQLKRTKVGLTITTTDDGISRLMEKHAPPASRRLEALRKLNKAGLDTYVCVNPILPHYANDKKSLKYLFQEIYNAGTRQVYVEHLNLRGQKKRRLVEEIGQELGQTVLSEFIDSQTDAYKNRLENLVCEILDDVGLEILGGGVIDHGKKQPFTSTPS